MPKSAHTSPEDRQLAESMPEGATRMSFAWDTNTALAVLVLGAVAYLWLLNRGFQTY